MKKYIFILISIFFYLQADAQAFYRDVVHLKNGSVIKGKIVEEVPNKTYTIKLVDSSLFVVNIEDIVKIVHEEIAMPQSAKKSSAGGGSNTLSKGYEGLAELGYGTKIGTYGIDVAKFNLVNGYRLNKTMFAGVGTGLRYFTTKTGDFSLIPLFLDFRWKPLDKPLSPYVAFSAGYAWDASHGFDDAGFLFNPQIGLQINKSSDMMFHIGFGYEIQQMEFPNLSQMGGVIMRFSEALSINAGITF